MIIPYSNENILYSGRFLTPIIGMQSAWQGNLVRFRVIGTSTITLTCDIKTVADGAPCAIASNIDNDIVTTSNNLANIGEVVTGERSVVINLPDSNVHDVIFKLSANQPFNQIDGVPYIKLKSITINDGGQILPYPVGSTKVMCLGDSWMSAWNDWIRLMDTTKYNVYPIAYGGAKASDINSYYPYQAGGINKYGDGVFNDVVICLGVNDYAGGISIASYKTSISSLIDKIRADQPQAIIYLLQAPRNVVNSKNFDQYGTALQELSVSKINTKYITTSSIWDSLTWQTDTYHLGSVGKQIFADFVASQIEISLPVLTTEGYIKLQLTNETLNIPYYNIESIDKNSLRIQAYDGIKCFRFVDITDSSASPLRVQTLDGIKAIAI